MSPVGGTAKPAAGDIFAESARREHGRAAETHAALRAFLRDPDFPCLGAKSVVNQNSYRFGLYERMGAPESTRSLANDLYQFVDGSPSNAGHFSSFIALFLEPKVRTPKQFERLLWRQLHALHRIDLHLHEWNRSVHSDPHHPEFSYSFGGHAFFIVGLTPASKRWARRFPWPTLVFNDHAQFERLRAEQRFERMKGAIRERDENLHGSPNAMLSDYGTHSEARQYAGRQVGADWRCPVNFDSKPNRRS